MANPEMPSRHEGEVDEAEIKKLGLISSIAELIRTSPYGKQILAVIAAGVASVGAPKPAEAMTAVEEKMQAALTYRVTSQVVGLAEGERLQPTQDLREAMERSRNAVLSEYLQLADDQEVAKRFYERASEILDSVKLSEEIDEEAKLSLLDYMTINVMLATGESPSNLIKEDGPTTTDEQGTGWLDNNQLKVKDLMDHITILRNEPSPISGRSLEDIANVAKGIDKQNEKDFRHLMNQADIEWAIAALALELNDEEDAEERYSAVLENEPPA